MYDPKTMGTKREALIYTPPRSKIALTGDSAEDPLPKMNDSIFQ